MTVTTTAAHGISSGAIVVISGVTDPSFNGGAVVSVTSATSFSYSQTGPNATWTAAPGGVSEAVVMFYGNNNAAGAIQEITSSEKGSSTATR